MNRSLLCLSLLFLASPARAEAPNPSPSFLTPAQQQEVKQSRADSRAYYSSQGLSTVMGQSGGLGYDACLRACATNQAADLNCARSCHGQYFGTLANFGSLSTGTCTRDSAYNGQAYATQQNENCDQSGTNDGYTQSLTDDEMKQVRDKTTTGSAISDPTDAASWTRTQIKASTPDDASALKTTSTTPAVNTSNVTTDANATAQIQSQAKLTETERKEMAAKIDSIMDFTNEMPH